MSVFIPNYANLAGMYTWNHKLAIFNNIGFFTLYAIWCGWSLAEVIWGPLEGAGSTLTMVPGLVELTSLFVEVICTMASFACGPGKFSLWETLATAEWVSEVAITSPPSAKPVSPFWGYGSWLFLHSLLLPQRQGRAFAGRWGCNLLYPSGC